MKTQADLEKMTAAELIALHNANVAEDKQVKKFADKTVAVRRTLQALARVNVEKAEKKAAKPAAVDRSAAIAASWTDPHTRELRAARLHVKVGSTNYKSVREAFAALNLPMSRHIKFRGLLRDAGELVFEHVDADGKTQKTKFKLVAGDAEK